jgi:hypothetical protein
MSPNLKNAAIAKKAAIDPVKLAQAAVRDYFAQVAGNINAVLDDGSGDETRIPLDVIDRIEKALIAEYVAQGGKEPKEDGDYELFAQQAGFLIGVAVGRRLRAEGGV